MKRYIKIANRRVIEAPKIKKTDFGYIFGYNNPENEDQLLVDGWTPYEGTAPLSALVVNDGQIVETVQKGKKVFTKLQIRRCLREYGLEAELDRALEESDTFRKDWSDASEITLDDEMITEAVSKGYISSEAIYILRELYKGE